MTQTLTHPDYLLNAWEQDACGGQTYRLMLQAPGGVRPGPDTVALVEWLVAATNGAARTDGALDPHKRVYLRRSASGWSDVCVAPAGTRRLRLLLCHWKQISPAPPQGPWTFTCEPVAPVPPRTIWAAVAYQQTVPPRTMESARAVTVATIRQAGQQKVELLVLSEDFFGRDVTVPWEECSRALEDPWMQPVYDAVGAAGLYAVFAFNEKRGPRRHTTAALVSPQGEVVGVYRKRHLTQHELERGVTPGDEWPVFPTPLGRIGMLVCWDGWFSGGAAALARRGAQIICFPLAGDGEDKHWDHIWRARALDNQVYWLASVTGDCGGQAPSRIVAPTGDVLAETRQPNGLACAELALPVAHESYWLSVGPVWSEIRNVYRHSELEPAQYQ